MKTIASPEEMQRCALALRSAGSRIGFVPTMGYLHEGHLSLVREARRCSDVTVVSIFVNPIQFNNAGDLAAYPQDLARDSAMLQAEGVDLLFAPQREVVYPAGFQTGVENTALSQPWEGAHRPGHFRGVTTVVNLLFNIVQPHRAVFGEKDFQQLRIIEQMVRDLMMPLEIVRGSLVREPDGLAMSSRNVRLSSQGRERALCLSRALRGAQALYHEGIVEAEALTNLAKAELLKGADSVEYVALVDEEVLAPTTTCDERSRILLACEVEGVRLIDNARPSGPAL